MKSIAFALAALSACAVALAAQQLPSAPPFRASVELIALDVQVADKDGAPITSLRPAQFTVTLDGKPRKVVSADLIGAATTATPSPPPGEAPPASSARPAGPATPDRMYVLAIDAMSFQSTEIAPAIEAARAFISRLRPTDLLGLSVFPLGTTLGATTDHRRVLAALDEVVGQEDPVGTDTAQMSPSMLVDLSRADVSDVNRDVETLRRSEPMLVNRAFAMCTDAPERLFCLQNLFLLAKAETQSRESQAKDRLSALRGLLRSLRGASPHKVVVLVSGGMMTADRDGGRPNLGDVGRLIGQAAAESNTTVYTLFYDRLTNERMANARRAHRPTDGPRDGAILSRPLQHIADASGGAFISIAQGSGEFAFDRVLQETSAYYLLGVEPEPRDRDGRPHELRVKVDHRDATVRGRSWVVLPSSTPVVRTMPDSMRELAAAYSRADYDTFDRLLSGTADLARPIRDLRLADFPWPESSRSDRVLALELALTGLSSGTAAARNEAASFLPQAHALMEIAGEDDPFACAWSVVAATGLQGLSAPDVGVPLATRAARQCPKEPHLSLARGVLLEQQWGPGAPAAQARAIVAAYEEAARGPDVAAEAKLRAAWFLARKGDAEGALALVPDPSVSAPDAEIRYFYHLVRGHVLRARGRMEEAEAAYRRALEEAPGAQSARVALMTLLMARGSTGDAQRLSEEILSARPDAVDPWWTYLRGEFPTYGARLATLRGMTR